MAWTSSYVPPGLLVAGLKANGARTAVDLSPANTNLKVALFGNTVTPNPDTYPQSYGAGIWASGECTGTNWPAGGVAVSVTAAGLTAQAGGVLQFTTAAVTVANTTIASPVYGFIIYDTALSNLVYAAVYLGGSTYTSSASPMGYTPPASGIWTVPLTPGN
jgi:hypothetical protein